MQEKGEKGKEEYLALSREEADKEAEGSGQFNCPENERRGGRQECKKNPLF